MLANAAYPLLANAAYPPRRRLVQSRAEIQGPPGQFAVIAQAGTKAHRAIEKHPLPPAHGGQRASLEDARLGLPCVRPDGEAKLGLARLGDRHRGAHVVDGRAGPDGEIGDRRKATQNDQ